MLDYKDLEDLRVLSCPLQVGDKMWIVHRPAGQESEVSPSEASEKSIAEETLSTHSQHSGIFLEIGTIAEVGDETIIISLHSGGSKILGQEFVQCEVDVHNDMVQLIVQEKKQLFDNVAASSENSQDIPDVTGSDTACTADANVSDTNTPVAENVAEASISVSVNQAGPLHNPPPPPSLAELHMPLSISDVTIAQATQIMQAAKLNARALKKRAKEELEGDVTNVQHLKKKLKLAMEDQKAAKALRAIQKASRMKDKAPEETHDEFGLRISGRKTKMTRLDNWQLGNKAARERKDSYLAGATCESLDEVRIRLKSHAWAVMNNMTDLFSESCRPTQEQADYILQTNEDNKVVIVEGALFSDASSWVNLDMKKDKLGGRCRYQLKLGGHSGAYQKKFVEYQKKYKPQLECILRGMFGDDDAGDVQNWLANINSIVGGVCHQHPHCDQGRVGTYQDLPVFPFVSLHGFGVYPFSLWILPQGVEYGFMHTFAADQIVFLRGDCVHAGVPSPTPRGHMEFFPLMTAGWARRNPYWTRPGYADVTFPWQHTTIPFAYPDVGTPNDQGVMAVSYPVSVTEALMHACKGETHTVPKKQRGIMKRRMSAQLVNH